MSTLKAVPNFWSKRVLFVCSLAGIGWLIADNAMALEAVWHLHRAALHPEKIGFYMVPDLDPVYTTNNAGGSASCPWGSTQTSLQRLHELLPDAWIRWDNETGHNSDDVVNVETFINCAEHANVPMIIAASAVDGYNNWWALGGHTPPTTILDISNGPYLRFAADLKHRHPIVRLIETINEPDMPFFFSNHDNAKDFATYLKQLKQVLGNEASSSILGPGVAVAESAIGKYYLTQHDLPNFSYHTYSAAASLKEFAGKKTYVTEYGGFLLDPAHVLEDLWNITKDGKLNGTIKKVFWVQLTDNGSNRGVFNHQLIHNDHFALRDWFLALVLYRQLALVDGHVNLDTNQPDVVSSFRDDKFAALTWNTQASTQTIKRSLPYRRSPSSALYVWTLRQGEGEVLSCAALKGHPLVQLTLNVHQLDLTIKDFTGHGAILISNRPCSETLD